MEVFNKIQNNLNILSEITIEDMFPSDIYYPNQKRLEEMETSAAEDEENILNSPNNFSENISSSKFSNTNKANFLNNPEENSNETEMEMNHFGKPKPYKAKNKLKKKSKGDKNIKNFKKMNFANLTEIWDIVLDNEIVAFCGKNCIKVFFFKSAAGGKSKSAFNKHLMQTSDNHSQIENIDLNEIEASQKSSNLSSNNINTKNPIVINSSISSVFSNSNSFKKLSADLVANCPSSNFLNPNNNLNSITNNNNSSICAAAKVSNKSQNELFEEEITFSDKNEEYYCLALSTITLSSGESRKILAVGGTKSIIKILDLTQKKEYMSLIGHRNEIYDLKFHPKHCNILLSASKDYSVRIWNIINGLQIAILAGPKGHSAEVLAVGWHMSGDYFVSSSIDNTVKIWEITALIKAKIEQSNHIDFHSKEKSNDSLKEKNIIEQEQEESCLMNNKTAINPRTNNNIQTNFDIKKSNSNSDADANRYTDIYVDADVNADQLINCLENEPAKKTKNKFKTLITTIPLFSCKTIHENYVDSVKFNGNFILSKSIDGVVKEWLPIFNKESDYHLIVNCYTYEINELVWYMKLGFDQDSKIFATGNTQGKLFVFKLNEDLEEEEIIDEDFDYYYNNSFNQTIDTGINKLIRSVAVFGNKVVFGNCDGSVFFVEVNLD